MTSRIGLIFVVYAYASVGVFLLTSPWSPIWEEVTLAIAPTAAGDLVRGGVVRGVISGLGGLNVWVALEQGARLVRSLGEAEEGDAGR